jgi:hypothetical protein
VRQLCHACVRTVGLYHQAMLWGHCWGGVLCLEKKHQDVLVEAGAMYACAFAWPQGSKSLSLQFFVSLILHLKCSYIVASGVYLCPVSSVSTPRHLVYGFSGAPEVAAPGSGLLPPNALHQPAYVLTQQSRSRWPPGPLFGQADAHKQANSAAVPQSRGYMPRQQHNDHAQPIMHHAMYSDRQHPVPQSPYFGSLPAVHHQQHMYQSGQQTNAQPKQRYVSSGPVPPQRQSTHMFGGQRPSGMYPQVLPSYRP